MVGKKSSRSGYLSSSSSSSSVSSPGRPQLSSTVSGEPAPAPQDLLEIVRSGTASLQQTAADWLESYEADPGPAMVRLVQFMVSATGCTTVVTAEMVESLETHELVEQVAARPEAFPGQGASYPAGAAGSEGRKFRANFSELLRQVVVSSRNSILYDGVLMDLLMGLVTSLSSCVMRPLRHTGSLAALTLLPALAGVAVREAKQQELTGRQLEAEGRKQVESRAADRMEVLRTKLDELAQNQEELDHIINYLFTSVFVLRCKDTADDIRSLCMQQLGAWVRDFPARFLSDSYLKYLGFSLSDTNSSVRLQSVQALLPLYEAPENRDKLELFTVKFKTRVLSLTLDQDIEVAVEAVRLLVLLARLEEMEDEECEQVYLLVYSRHRKLGQAAGVFLQERLQARGGSGTQVTRSRRGKLRRPASSLLRDIVTFSVEVELEGMEPFLVDSLQDCSAMRDWEALADLLLEEAGPGEEALVLEDVEAVALVSLMVAGVKQGVTGQPPEGRGGQKKVLTVREQAAGQAIREEASLVLLPCLPRILNMFLETPDTAAQVMELLQWLDPEVFTVGRQEAALDSLLVHCQEAVMQQDHPPLLAAISRSLERLCSPGLSVQVRCSTARSQLLDSVAEQFRSSLEDVSSRQEDAEQSVGVSTEPLKSSLTRLVALFPCHDMSPYNLFSTFLEICKWSGPGDQEEFGATALACCYFSLLWQLKGRRQPRSRNRAGELQQRLDQFKTLCEEAVQGDGGMAAQAFLSLCDLLLAVGQSGPAAAAGPGEEAQPGILVTRETVDKLKAFVEELVMDESPGDDIPTVNMKRKMLASFCRLVTENVVPVSCFSFILRQLLRQQDRFGDIIKSCLDELRETSRPLCGRLMLEAMSDGLQELGLDDRAGREFAGLRELARRLASSLGVEPLRNRETLLGLHREGVKKATERGGKVVLLELLREFTGRLLPEDRKDLAVFLGTRVRRPFQCDDEATAVIQDYRRGLQGQARGKAVAPE